MDDAAADTALKLQRLQKLKDLEVEKRKQKNAKLGKPNRPVPGLSRPGTAVRKTSTVASPGETATTTTTNEDTVRRFSAAAPPSPTAPRPTSQYPPTVATPTSPTSPTSPTTTTTTESKEVPSRHGSAAKSFLVSSDSEASVEPDALGSSAHPSSTTAEEQEESPVAAVAPVKPLAALGLAAVYDPTTIATSAAAGDVSKEPARNAGEPPRTMTSLPIDGQPLTDVSNLPQLVQTPTPQGRQYLCRIVRHKDGLEKLFPSYEVFLEQPDGTLAFLMAARKRKKSKNTIYTIFTERLAAASNGGTGNAKQNVVGKLRSNFVGTEFMIYDQGYNPAKGRDDEHGPDVRVELGAILYDPNILGLRGPRKMHVVIPAMTKEGSRIFLQPHTESETLLAKLKRQQTQELLELDNKSPQWSEEHQSYILNFNGRVTVASVKNFQIVHKDDLNYIVLQFGRIGEDSFTLDFQYPMSPLQAFAIALSSFDAKLACE